jgi:hypothetical protein
MNARPQGRGETSVARHDQDQAARTAYPGEVSPQPGPIRVIVVAEYDAGQAARQPADGRAWVM